MPSSRESSQPREQTQVSCIGGDSLPSEPQEAREEQAEEPEIKLPTFVGSQRKQANARKTTSASLTMLKPLTGQITTNYGRFLKRWECQTPYQSPEKPACRSRSNSQNQTWNNGLFLNWERSTSRLYIDIVYSTYTYNTSCVLPGWMKHMLKSRLLRRNINNLRYSDDTTLRK